MKTFSDEEKIIAKDIDKDYLWMARDSDGFLYVFRDKPEKGGWIWDTSASDSASPFLFNDMFSSIKWEDEEPTLISSIYSS